MTTLTLTAKGQVTFNRDVRQHLQVEPGGRIDIELLPNGACIVQAAKPSTPMGKFIGFLAGRSSKVATLEEIDTAITQSWARS